MRRQTQQFNDERQLIILTVAGEERVAQHQLSQDTAQRPHVHRWTILTTQDHLGSSVEPALNITV